MHNKVFFISGFDKQNRLWSEEVTGLSGLIAKLWLVYEDDNLLFDTIQIIVVKP